jgi:REP element-mobilizing transposase RayT
MPDHAHVLFIGRDESSNALAAMEYFKWRTGAQFSAKKMLVRWQKDFYDDILSGAESWAAVARYIALNPVRAELAKEPEDWPYSGSCGYSLDDVLTDAFTIA